MAVREDEAITIGPDRILRIEAQYAIPDRVDQRRESHRRAGVSGFGLLHRVDRKRANGVDAQLIEFKSVKWFTAPAALMGSPFALALLVAMTLARRRRWRSAWLMAARNASTRSQARNGPNVRAPRQIMFM